jgi:hypothetical protein
MSTIPTTTTPPTIESEVDKFYGRIMDRYKRQDTADTVEQRAFAKQGAFSDAFLYFQSITKTNLRDQDATQKLLDRLPPEFAAKVEAGKQAAELFEKHRYTPCTMTETKVERIAAKTIIDHRPVVNSIVELVDETTRVYTHPLPDRCSTQVHPTSYWYIITEVLPDNKFKGYATDSGIDTLVEFSLAQVHAVLEDYDPEEDEDATKDQKFDLLFRTETNHRRKVKSSVTKVASTEIFCRTPAQALALAQVMDAGEFDYEEEDEDVYDDDEWDFETYLRDIEVSLNEEVVDSADFQGQEKIV